eukprot:6147887-Amphidinium_carterae.1
MCARHSSTWRAGGSRREDKEKVEVEEGEDEVPEVDEVELEVGVVKSGQTSSRLWAECAMSMKLCLRSMSWSL